MNLREVTVPRTCPSWVPLIEWGHMVNQLNQDPWADLIADSGHGTAVMEESGADVVGDEEVKGRDERVTVGAEAGDLVWDPWDPLFEFNDKNSGITHTPVAALTPVSMPSTDEMPDLKELDSEGPPVEGPSEGLPANDLTVTSIRELGPDYSDIPLVGFSQPELTRWCPGSASKPRTCVSPLGAQNWH